MDDLELEPAPLAGPTAADADQGYDPGMPDPAAEAEDVRRKMAARTARSFVRNPARTPASMTELVPAKVTSDEEYQALQPGSFFTGPDNIKRRKPWYVTDDKTYDAVPEGEEFVDPQGQRRAKPKYEDLPFTVQTLYNMAVNDKERVKILEQAYPGKVKTTGRGELYVEEEGGVRRRGKGFADAPGAFIASQAAPVAGGVLGEIGMSALGHRAVPFVGGMLGGVAGGGMGAAGGQMFNDTIMSIAGVYDRTSEEAAGKIATEGVMGAAGSAAGRILLPMAPNLVKYAREAAPGALAKFLGANKESLDTAVGLADRGVQVPPSTWAKEAPHLQNLTEVLDPAFRTQRPLEQSATQHMERQGGAILKELGIEDAGPLVKPTSAVPTEEAGTAIKAKLMEDVAASDAALADRVAAARAQAMAEDVLGGGMRQSEEDLLRIAEVNRIAAQRLIDDGFRDIQGSVDDAMRAVNADTNSGGLWQQVAQRLRALRQAVVQRHRAWYQQADEVAGGEVPNIGNLPQTAEQMLGQLPPGFEGRYPTIVQRIRDIAGRRNEAGEWIIEPSQPTFGQLHELRTQLRSDVDWYSLNSSIDDGVNKFFARQVDDILHDPGASPALRTASQMLDATDRSYGANMAAFNDARLKSVIKGIESGLPADPAMLFDTLVRSGRSDLTNWVRERVGPNLWAGVRAADVQEMLDASRTLIPGQIDGAQFVKEVLKRHRGDMLEAVHGPEAARLMRQAQDVMYANGTIDIPVRPGDTISEIVARARQATEAAQNAARQSPMDTLEREVKRITREHRATAGQTRQNDPLGSLMKPSVGATEAVNRILAKEDTILAAAARFGEKSPEFDMLRQIYAQRFLRETMQPGDRLAKVSPELQQLMFPGVTLEQMQLLAKEMDFLMGSKSAKGGAGRSIMATERVEHPWAAIPGGKAVGKFIPGVDAAGRAILGSYYKFMTEMVTSPAFLKFVQRGLQGSEAERFTARNMINAMIHGPGSRRGGAVGAGTGAGVGATPMDQRREVDPALIQQMRAAQ